MLAFFQIILFLCIWETQISEKKQIYLRIRAGMAEVRIVTMIYMYHTEIMETIKEICYY